MGELEQLNIPLIKTINGTLNFSGDYYTNNKLTNLEFFAVLNSLKAVTIKYNNALVDFSGLKNALNSVSADGWNVSDNAYNPTYTDAKAGKLIKPWYRLYLLKFILVNGKEGLSKLSYLLFWLIFIIIDLNMETPNVRHLKQKTDEFWFIGSYDIVI